MRNTISFYCPTHRLQLETDGSSERYTCPSGCTFPVVDNIPRFVDPENYAASFGLQWNEYRTTQLDTYTGTSISADRLTRLVGGSLNIFNGKKVLEAGCGAGRFTEVMLAANAQVFAVDVSSAVEANYMNCRNYPNYFVCQADIRALPLQPEQFDVVVCIGVIQHTPDPEVTMATLCSHVRPGGLLVIDHYTHGYPVTSSRRVLRWLLLRSSRPFAMWFCRALTAVLWPIHKMLWNVRAVPGCGRLRSTFIRWSPIIDYHDAYPNLGPRLLYEWALLDTHDTLTDRYKHLRSADEISSHLKECGMTQIETVYAGNGVEARARKPSARTADGEDQADLAGGHRP